jgi:hypothetical protein
VRVQNLLGVCERTLQATTDNVQVLRHLPEKLMNMLATQSLMLISRFFA